MRRDYWVIWSVFAALACVCLSPKFGFGAVKHATARNCELFLLEGQPLLPWIDPLEDFPFDELESALSKKRKSKELYVYWIERLLKHPLEFHFFEAFYRERSSDWKNFRRHFRAKAKDKLGYLLKDYLLFRWQGPRSLARFKDRYPLGYRVLSLEDRSIFAWREYFFLERWREKKNIDFPLQRPTGDLVAIDTALLDNRSTHVEAILDLVARVHGSPSSLLVVTEQLLEVNGQLRNQILHHPSRLVMGPLVADDLKGLSEPEYLKRYDEILSSLWARRRAHYPSEEVGLVSDDRILAQAIAMGARSFVSTDIRQVQTLLRNPDWTVSKEELVIGEAIVPVTHVRVPLINSPDTRVMAVIDLSKVVNHEGQPLNPYRFLHDYSLRMRQLEDQTLYSSSGR